VKPWVNRKKKIQAPVGRQKINERFYLSPLPGLGWFLVFNPRLTPWATLCRASGAELKIRFGKIWQ
jgi:hypothetical protein